MPISTRRVTPLAASFVCRVEKTRCPVSAVCIVTVSYTHLTLPTKRIV